MLSDLVVIDFINFLAKLSLSRYIASGGPPSIMQVRKYCTRHGRGGFNVSSTRNEDVGMFYVER
jgi:hypothetical protein